MTLRALRWNEVSPMSSRNVGFPTPDTLADRRLLSGRLPALVRFVGFWLAIALPLVYLPLLLGGLSGWQAPTFGVLFALNVVALIAGHDYGRDQG